MHVGFRVSSGRDRVGLLYLRRAPVEASRYFVSWFAIRTTTLALLTLYPGELWLYYTKAAGSFSCTYVSCTFGRRSVFCPLPSMLILTIALLSQSSLAQNPGYKYCVQAGC